MPLRSVKDKSEFFSTCTGKLLGYEEHATFLLSTETGYDSQFTSTSSRITMKVHHTELGVSDFEPDSLSEVIEDLDYSMDAFTTTLLANMNNRGNSNSNSYLP